jgi:hypothetical protein
VPLPRLLQIFPSRIFKGLFAFPAILHFVPLNFCILYLAKLGALPDKLAEQALGALIRVRHGSLPHRDLGYSHLTPPGNDGRPLTRFDFRPLLIWIYATQDCHNLLVCMSR